MKFDDEMMDLYLKDINRIPLLTAEEEKKLAVEARNGSKSAKNKLVNANLRFVVAIAKTYQGRGFELMDLISEGNLGLMTAVDHFDVSKGYKFISYAVWWIRQSIQKAIYDRSRAIRLPMNKVNELYQIEKARTMVETDMAEDEQITEIAKILGMEASYVRNLLNFNRDMLSLDAPIDSTKSDAVMGDIYKDEINPTPEQAAMEDALKNDVEGALKTLKPKAERVLRMRYGLGGYKAMSLKEIGDACGLTKERIRQIEKGAVQMLQSPSRRRRLEAYVA
ncbi:MAG: sigma-70 family RNA polymerase sigma factor [Treponema sp.]|uniref:sigma-70 family RNA polymerase sigma factor n=1 Tax=Treponema sp. TaxID=166 RepID=UPI0025FF0A29|nr:sigma-70 family RNA polymerase sigma factor [Treponema sp.]MBQ9622726.1 sigma-70 family RNA polymerase sigma factor [Treponema sp.]MBR0100832.1 sigma-70 family RNA polymerase sigma factor [Treponema sp.]MBR0494587.1 sigma-70 family RNA polymerase sigma factor [Treponema sp.]